MSSRLINGLAAAAIAALLAGCSMLPDGKSRQTAAPQTSRPPVAVSQSARQCLSDLGTARASFTPIADKYYGAGCSTLSSVNLSSLRGDSGDFALANLGPVSCP